MWSFVPMFTTVAFLSGFASTAHATEATAENCIKQKVWEGYNQGYGVRTMAVSTLGNQEYKVYKTTLYAGNEYKFLACGDEEITNVDLVLYDVLGNRLAFDPFTMREPFLVYTPSTTDTFYIVVHATQMTNPTRKGAAAIAVTYK